MASACLRESQMKEHVFKALVDDEGNVVLPLDQLEPVSGEAILVTVRFGEAEYTVLLHRSPAGTDTSVEPQAGNEEAEVLS